MRLFNLALLTVSLLTYTTIFGQTATVHTSGLTTPNKIIRGPDNSLIVAEAGTTTANTGRLSIIDRTSGARHTLISGLPSAVSFLGGPAGDPDGPSGIVLRGNRLLVAIGVGDSVLPGGGPGLETPNPTPSSPIFNSVLELTLPGGFALLESAFVLTPANQTTLDGGTSVTLTNAEGVELTIRLVADLPDWRPAATPTVPTNVKASHLYGIETFQRNAYLADAGHNDIKVVDLDTGAWAVFATFPGRPNPNPGPPFIEAVPSNIHRFGNRLLVPLLTGFPFVPGIAEVRRVNIKDGTDDQLIGGLTSAMDVLKIDDEEDEELQRKGEVTTSDDSLVFAKGALPSFFKGIPSRGLSKESSEDSLLDPGDGSAYYTLEFSTNLLGGAPGRLRFYASRDSAPVNVLTNLITPTSMTRDPSSGNLFITNIGPGHVTKVTFP